MTKSQFRILAALLVMCPLGASGAGVNHSWDDLRHRAKAGSRIVVTRMNSTEAGGKLVTIDDESIGVEAGGVRQTIARADVYRVRSARRGRHAVYGLLIGTFAGAAVLGGADQASKSPRPSEAVPMGAILGAVAGAITGGALPPGGILYQAEKRPWP
jgi:hypothetical protein